MLARRAAAEVAPGDEDGRASVARLVQDERGVGRAVRRVAPVVEEELAEARPLHALEELLRDDLIRVNVRAVERGRDAGVCAKWKHKRSDE